MNIKLSNDYYVQRPIHEFYEKAGFRVNPDPMKKTSNNFLVSICINRCNETLKNYKCIAQSRFLRGVRDRR